MSQCENCGENMIGDGYTTVEHCPNSVDPDVDFAAPDEGPFFCELEADDELMKEVDKCEC